MQCSRCGYFNSETETSCVKCNTPLIKKSPPAEGRRKTQELPGKGEVDDFLKKTIAEKPDSYSNDFSAAKTVAEFSVSKTISDIDKSASKSTQQQSNQDNKVNVIPCPVCNYPVSGAPKFCPGCNHDLSKPVDNKPSQQKNQTSVKMKTRAPQKTVNLFAVDESADEKKIILTEIKQNGKKDIELISNGKKICLNKETLQQENNTAISANAHADIINFEGDWYLVNRTSAGTTFVAANKPHKLEDEDTILIGNTIYRFNG